MGISVNALTVTAQGALRSLCYGLRVSTREPITPADRIALAIERSGKKLEAIGAEIGCSHVALSLWRSGKTDASHIKAGLLQAFADATGVEARWLLTGDGPAVSRYVLPDEMQRVAVALRAMERNAPQQVETVVRMIEAAAGVTPPPPPDQQ